jgi:hypothetical protein
MYLEPAVNKLPHVFPADFPPACVTKNLSHVCVRAVFCSWYDEKSGTKTRTAHY